MNHRIVYEGENITLSSVIVNHGIRSGTVYVRFLVADTYDRKDVVFDSDRHTSENERRSLRVEHIGAGEQRTVACGCIVPPGTVFKHFDICVDVCNPHWLFRGPWPLVFDRLGWIGGFEVISKPPDHSLTVFVSYSWESDEHERWVLQLVEEFRRYNIDCLLDKKDLLPGEEATAFMERAIANSRVTLLICTETYTARADARAQGGVGFETIISSHEYFARTPEDRARFIPVVRDNSRPKYRKLPRYLGSAIYVNMSGGDWRAEPMLRLVSAIRRFI